MIETSVTIINNSYSQGYYHLDDLIASSNVTPVFKPFAALLKIK